jgi:hypothetical protein
MHTSLANRLNNVLACMEENFFTPADFIDDVLGSTELRYESARDSLTTKAVNICTALHREEHSHSHVTQWAITIVRDMLCTEVTELSLEKHGLRFNATSVTVEQLESTSMHQLAEKMQRVAPNLWHLFVALLDSTLQQRRAMGGNVKVGNEDMDVDVEERDLGEFGGDDIGGMMCEEDDMNEEADGGFEKQSGKRQRRAAERNAALLIIVSRYSRIKCCVAKKKTENGCND